MLMGAQALQGFGGGLARSGFTGGASVAVEPHEQGAAAGLVVAINGAGFIFSPVLGGVAYEHLGMTAPLIIATAIIIAMFTFALMSRRLRDSVVAMPAPEPEPT
jgi:MFS family permease